MVIPRKVADALSRLMVTVNSKDGVPVLHTGEISSTDRVLLSRTGWLQQIIKGWYILTRSDAPRGETTSLVCQFLAFPFGLFKPSISEKLLSLGRGLHRLACR